MNRFHIFAAALVLSACTQPLDTVVPTSADKMGSIRIQVDKLSPEEKGLFLGYLSEHQPVPEGLTIRKAIELQRKELAAVKEKIRSLKENWQYDEKKDKFTDETKAFASISALEDNEEGFISVGCFPSGIEVKVGAGKYIGDSQLHSNNVKYRVDSNPAVSMKMNPTSKTYVYENDRDSGFLKALTSGKRVVVELTSYNFETSSATFSLNGAKPAIDKVLALCDGRKK